MKGCFAIRIIEFRAYQMFYRVTFWYFKFHNSTLIGVKGKKYAYLYGESETAKKETEKFIQQFSSSSTHTHTREEEKKRLGKSSR